MQMAMELHTNTTDQHQADTIPNTQASALTSRPAQNERHKPSPEEIVARKLRLLDHPQSILLVPRSAEGRALLKILFVGDRLFHYLRMRAGTYIPVETVAHAFQRIQIFIQEVTSLVQRLAGGVGMLPSPLESMTPETRRTVATMRISSVFVPRTDEGRQLALLAKQLDTLLLQFRATCTDFTTSAILLGEVVELLRTFDGMVRDLAKEVGFAYREVKINTVFKRSGP